MLYPIKPIPTFGKASHAYWENFLSDEDINLLLAQPEWLSLETGCIGTVEQNTRNKEIRSSHISWLYPKKELSHVWEKVSNMVAEVNSRFFHLNLTGFYEPMQISAYTASEQNHYAWHTDSIALDRTTPRKLSLAMLLSDPSEFEGGEFQIKASSDEAETLECAKGRAWLFPSYTLHRVTPVTKGVRRSLVLWIGGPEFR